MKSNEVRDSGRLCGMSSKRNWRVHDNTAVTGLVNNYVFIAALSPVVQE